MAADVGQLLKMSQADLDALYEVSESGPIPDGEGKGTVIIAPGAVFSPEIANFVSLFAWQGKLFDAKAGLLRNHILPFGLKAVLARVYVAPSWIDQRDCVVLDYSETTLTVQWLRDEIRLISPGLYLGKVFWNHARLMDFALQF